MRLAALLSLSLLALSCSTAARAADDCRDARDQATMNECAGKDFEKADGELNTLYKEIAARLKGSPDAAKLLIPAQRAWIAFRDAECAFSASGSAQGSIYPMAYSMCLTSLTNARINDFKAYLKCDSNGDPSCPLPAK